MAVYGNRVANATPAKKVVKETYAYHSVILDEYNNYSAMLENCTSASEGVILEAQVKVLRESVGKDIFAKLKGLITKVVNFIEDAITKIEAFITAAVAKHGLIKYWQSKPTLSDKQLQEFKDYVGSSPNVTYFTFDPMSVTSVKDFQVLLQSAFAGEGSPEDIKTNSENFRNMFKKRTEINLATYKGNGSLDAVKNDIETYGEKSNNIENIISGNNMFAAKKVLNDYKHLAEKCIQDANKFVTEKFGQNAEGRAESLDSSIKSISAAMATMKERANTIYNLSVFQYKAVLKLTIAGIKNKPNKDEEPAKAKEKPAAAPAATSKPAEKPARRR